jgi:tetratricopeptide (TPR) repeat protein
MGLAAVVAGIFFAWFSRSNQPMTARSLENEAASQGGESETDNLSFVDRSDAKTSTSLISSEPKPRSEITPDFKAPPLSPKETSGELPQSIDQEMLNLVLLMQAKYATGDFDGSLRYAEQILGKAGLSQEVRTYIENQLPAILVSCGWSHLRFGRYDQAIELFQRSRRIKGLSEATKGLAVAYFKLRRVNEAIQETEAYLKIDPSDVALLAVLSDLYESQNRYDEAVQTLGKAEQQIQKQTGGDPEQNLSLIQKQKRNMKQRADIAKTQRSESGGSFKLSYSEIEHDQLAGWVLVTLEEALDDFTSQFGLKPPKESIEVILYSRQAYQAANEESPTWADGLFDGRIRVPISQNLTELEQQRRLRGILRHELVHALMAVATDRRSLPPWFDEGLAQRLSCPNTTCRPVEFQLNHGAFLKPIDLIAPFVKIKDPLRANRAYQQSLYLVLTLENLSGDDSLRSVIEQIRGDTPLDSDTLLKPIGMTFEQLVRRAEKLWLERNPL